MSLHNNASLEDIAQIVIMPGDPLRAKYIAEKYLSDAILINEVRNMYGYTGYYKNKRITVMASGMGINSMALYSYELYVKYNVEIIIRLGSAASYGNNKLFDIILADEVYSESNYLNSFARLSLPVIKASEELLNHFKDENVNINRIHTSECFYYYIKEDKDYLLNTMKCQAVDMETYALYANAYVLNKKALSVLTITDTITKEKATQEERVTALDKTIIYCLNKISELL